MATGAETIDVPPPVLHYLASHNTLTLATASRAGVPHAATEVYVNDGLKMYFATPPNTVTAGHIDHNPAVAFTIDDYSEDWSKTKGIQGSGTCEVVLQSDEIDTAVALFKKKFSFLSDADTVNLSVFRITPTEIQYIDNEGSGGNQAGGTLGIAFRREMVYNVFSELPTQEVEEVVAKLDTLRIGAGEVIVREGAPADKFFIIEEGEVEVVKAAGGAEPVATLKRGQFFGEIAILRDLPRQATVRAITDTTLLTMDRDVFKDVMAQSLATTQNFDEIIQQRLSHETGG